jgi:hypothetical protein
METPNEGQTLIVLGAERVARVVAEDQVEALEQRLAEVMQVAENQSREIETLKSEKATLLLDIDNQRQEIERLKGGDNNGDD